MREVGRTMKLPFIKFYPRDWQADMGLRQCSLAARGLWFEMLCIMAQSEQYGHLVNTSRVNAISDDSLCRLIGCSKDDLYRLRDELLDAGVPGVDESTGTWFSRRMVREQHKRELCAEAGKAGGGSPLLKSRGTDIRNQIPEARNHISIKGTSKDDLYRESEGDKPKRKQSKTDMSTPPFPECLDNELFREAFDGFLESRKAKGAKATRRAQVIILKRLAERPGKAIPALEKCIERNWTSFEWEWIDKLAPPGKTDTPVKSNTMWELEKKLAAVDASLSELDGQMLDTPAKKTKWRELMDRKKAIKSKQAEF